MSLKFLHVSKKSCCCFSLFPISKTSLFDYFIVFGLRIWGKISFGRIYPQTDIHKQKKYFLYFTKKNFYGISIFLFVLTMKTHPNDLSCFSITFLINYFFFHRMCGQSSYEEESCIVACPTDCHMSTWSDWGMCDAICGAGLKNRTSKVIKRHAKKTFFISCDFRFLIFSPTNFAVYLDVISVCFMNKLNSVS